MTREYLASLGSAACAVLLLAAGCGYTLVRYEGALGDARSVAIAGLRNRTLEPGLDALLTDALRSEFQRRGALHLVDDSATADLVVNGEVAELETRRISVSSVQFALEYELRLALELDVRRRDGTPVPIDPDSLWETEVYLASGDVEVVRRNRREALRRLASLLAGRIHEALFERPAP